MLPETSAPTNRIEAPGFKVVKVLGNTRTLCETLEQKRKIESRVDEGNDNR